MESLLDLRLVGAFAVERLFPVREGGSRSAEVVDQKYEVALPSWDAEEILPVNCC